MRKHKLWMLLLTVCLLLTVTGALWLTAPWDSGVKPDILFEGADQIYEVDGQTIRVTEAEQTVHRGRLLLRGWRLWGGNSCVMGSLYTEKRTFRRQAIWQSETAQKELTIRWFDGTQWQTEPLREGRFKGGTAYFLSGEGYSALCYVPQIWSLLENGARKLLPDNLGWLQAKETESGWHLAVYAPAMPDSCAADFTYIEGPDELINWNKEGQADLWSNYCNAGTGRWCYDGYYFVSPDSYLPEGENVYYKNAASYMIKSFLYQRSTPVARVLAVCMMDTTLRNQNEIGYWPTNSLSTWLRDDYGIGAGFYDTRFNTDFIELLIYAQDYYPSSIYRDAMERYCEFYKWFAQTYHKETASGGWLIPDYWHKEMTSIPHTSLNHQLAECLRLYEMADRLGQSELRELADKLLLAVEDTGEGWIRPDHNLHYSVTQDGVFGGNDYPYLTYNDLFGLQSYLVRHFGQSNNMLETLMAHKKIWMDANGITEYRKS